MRQTTAKSAKAAADRACRELVRLRGACQRCLGTRDLQWAHIRRRHYVGDPDGTSLRTNPENSWLLCPECHRTVDTDQVAFVALVEQTIGLELYEEFVRLSHANHRPWRKADWLRERDHLRGLLEAAGKARA